MLRLVTLLVDDIPLFCLKRANNSILLGSECDSSDNDCAVILAVFTCKLLVIAQRES